MISRETLADGFATVSDYTRKPVVRAEHAMSTSQF